MEINYSQEMTKEELEIIRKFMEQFRGQDVIVADQYSQQFEIIPFTDEKAFFMKGESHTTGMSFQRIVNYQDKPFVVNFSLNNFIGEDNSTQLKPREIIITGGDGKTHRNRFIGEDVSKLDWLDEMTEFFGGKDIKSPLAVYGSRMITNRELDELIKNHEWGTIKEELEKMEELKNALFLYDKYCGHDNILHKSTNISEFSADYATILFFLISVRKSKKDNLSEKELKELDDLILMLSDSDLLRVSLAELKQDEVIPPYLAPSILLEAEHFVQKTTSSSQYNVANGGVSSAEKTLQMIKDSRR